MRAVIQRVTEASVSVDEQVVGEIGPGLLVLLGVGPGDTEREVQWMAKKVSGMRIFQDASGRMNDSALDLNLGILVVSQFTLYGDCRKGKRPNFMGAAAPEMAEPLYESFCEALKELGISDVQLGRFGAMMSVSLCNDGPVTLILDSPN